MAWSTSRSHRHSALTASNTARDSPCRKSSGSNHPRRSSSVGAPISGPRTFRSTPKALLQRAGVRDARLHDARHTAATLLLQQGVPARVAMQLLGHFQISMTMHYTHVVDELAHAAALSMTKALWD